MFLSNDEIVEYILTNTAASCGFSVEMVRDSLAEMIERAIAEDDVILTGWQEELGELNVEKVLLKILEIVTDYKNSKE